MVGERSRDRATAKENDGKKNGGCFLISFHWPNRSL
jgi:hypothetical protein